MNINKEEIIGGMGTYAHLAFGLVRQIRPKIVVEIGLGESARAAQEIINALLLNRRDGFDGKYYVIEKFPTKKGIEVLETSDNLAMLIVGDSQSPGIIKKHIHGQAELVFIDACHEFNNVVNDVLQVLMSNLLAVNGILVFHDIWMTTVRQAIKKIADEFDMNVLYLRNENVNTCLATFKI